MQFIQFFQSHPFITLLLVAFLVANVLDILTTVRALRLGGHEANPFIRVFIDFWPERPRIGLIVGKVIFAALFFSLLPYGDPLALALTLGGVLFFYVVVIAHNVSVIKDLEH